MDAGGILHVTSLLGGGVDRHVRDIARNVPRRHLVWHTADEGDVIELPAEGSYLALDGSALDGNADLFSRWLRAHHVACVHVHSVSEAVRRRASWAAKALGLRTVVTLHDILFLRENALDDGVVAPDPQWLSRTAPFLANAAAVLAPSQFIAGLAHTHVPGVVANVVPNGSPPVRNPPPNPRLTDSRGRPHLPRERGSFTSRPTPHASRPRHVAAMLGAIGPHKGSAIVEALAQSLAGTGIAVVIIGYLDSQVLPGWRGDGVFIHGAYSDDEVPGLLAAYGAELALFPNRAPESFSYALSDIWDAGLPAIVPPAGALAERVRTHGGGWILPEAFGAAEVKALLERLFSPEGSAEVARVKSELSRTDPLRVPRLDDMARSLDALYARFSVDPRPPLDAGTPDIQSLLARNIDGSLFRVELVRLADEYAQLQAALEDERARAKAFADEARGWIAKLEGDVAGLKEEIGREVEARRALGQENVQLGIHKAAFDLLPEFVRKLLLKRVLNAGS